MFTASAVFSRSLGKPAVSPPNGHGETWKCALNRGEPSGQSSEVKCQVLCLWAMLLLLLSQVTLRATFLLFDSNRIESKLVWSSHLEARCWLVDDDEDEDEEDDAAAGTPYICQRKKERQIANWLWVWDESQLQQQSQKWAKTCGPRETVVLFLQ